MLAKLQRLWIIEATKYNVLPIDDRLAERFNADIAGRPTLIHGDSQLFFAGMGRLSENSVVSIKNKSFSVTAEIEVPEGGAEGVIIAQGGRFGGWAVYVKDGKAKFVYNVLGIQEFATEADTAIPAGTHQVRMEFAYDGGGLAKGGDVTLYYDGDPVGTGRVEATQPMIFSADETTDIGYESGTTVTPDYTAGDQPVHRQDPLGADRPRRRRQRPLHRPRGAPPRRDGPAVGRPVNTPAGAGGSGYAPRLWSWRWRTASRSMSGASWGSSACMSTTSPRAKPRSMTGRTWSRSASPDSTSSAEVSGCSCAFISSRKIWSIPVPRSRWARAAIPAPAATPGAGAKKTRPTNPPSTEPRIAAADVWCRRCPIRGSMTPGHPGNGDGVMDLERVSLPEVPQPDLPGCGAQCRVVDPDGERGGGSAALA